MQSTRTYFLPQKNGFWGCKQERLVEENKEGRHLATPQSLGLPPAASFHSVPVRGRLDVRERLCPEGWSGTRIERRLDNAFRHAIYLFI